jgi:hypothetical protein
MTGIRSVLPPSSLAEILRVLSDLNETEYAELRAAVGGDKPFASDEDTNKQLAPKVGLSALNLTALLGVLKFLYDRLEDDLPSDVSRSDGIDLILKQVLVFKDDAKNYNAVHSRLTSLLSYNEAYTKFQKVKRLERGFIANLLEANTFLDIRPSISKDRKEIEGTVNVFQLNLITDSNNETLSDITIQLTRKSMKLLIDALDDLKKKDELVSSKTIFGEVQSDKLDV